MKKIVGFMKKEPVLFIAAILMVSSVFVVPPGRAYFEYVDFKVLALLFCLMAVVAGLKEMGIFTWISLRVGKKISTVKGLAILLSLICFLGAMLITNDVILITFVPLTMLMMKGQKQGHIIRVVVLETIAANLGSCLTPIGNPQNLFLYEFASYEVPAFLFDMAPVAGISLIGVLVCAFFIPASPLSVQGNKTEKIEISKGKLLLYILLFAVCLLEVFHVMHFLLMLGLVLVALLIFDRRIFAKVDYMLLLTFVAFFVFIGNLSQLEGVRFFLEGVLSGREIPIGILSSQIFSNVPAAMLLAEFSTDMKGLLWGVNIGGLGTLIASMASLISYKIYAADENSRKGAYMGIFTIYNVGFLLVLGLMAWLFYS